MVLFGLYIISVSCTGAVKYVSAKYPVVKSKDSMNFFRVSNSGYSQLSLRRTAMVPALTVHLTTCVQVRYGYPNPTWVLGLP